MSYFRTNKFAQTPGVERQRALWKVAEAKAP
jgi:hypothetical protein